MSIYLGDKKLAGTSVKLSHNIGDIFFTSRTDTFLAGAVECNGATYQTTSYTGEGSIGELLSAGKLPYISLSQYASDLAAHGSVRAFGWDGGSTTAFRIPTLQDVFLEAGQAASAGEYISAGLPNITGSISQVANLNSSVSGAFSKTSQINGDIQTTSSGTYKRNAFDFNASDSNPIYGNSSTVQPNSVKYRAMVQLYNAVTDEALATCENVESDIENLKTSLNNKITNCITYIPQDIKLELSNGTLTLKAGSKVYVPNGAGVFNTITTENDIVQSGFASSGQFFLGLRIGGIGFEIQRPEDCASGTNPGTYPTGYSGWYYKTDDNTIKLYSSGTPTADVYSLPIGIFSSDGTNIVSLDQVFNGFGYIGSTVFALPGVKGLIPNGRNADGTLKSTEITISNVLTGNATVASSSHDILLQSSSITFDDDIYEPNWQFVYKEPENIIVNTGNGAVLAGVLFGKCITASNTKITSFTSKTTFHAVDYNEADFVVAFQRPTASNNYTWYRRYKSGWVEQGGITGAINGVGTTASVTLPVKMANTYYSVYVTITRGAQVDFRDQFLAAGNRSVTGFTVYSNWAGSGNGATDNYGQWEVKGMAA